MNFGAIYNILTVQEGKIAHIGNKTKRRLENITCKIYVEAQRLKVAKMYMKKEIEEGR